MHHLLQIWFGWVQHWGYPGIILLMAMESSIIPVPSEIVIPPAAFLAARGQMNVWGVIAAGTFGSWIGAVVSYWISRWVGRLVIVKWRRFFFISEDKLERAESWLQRYEAGGIFFARLLPVIRHLISIPAGIVRMNFTTFSIMTIIGSAAWCGVLAWFGQTAITPEMLQDPATMAAALKAKSHLIVGGVAVLCVLYFVVLRLTAKREA
ncbi:MAG: DedA family protein [Verrucomicrobiota bacterium]|nr:DedA family protein [Verrucomicrobiota bacterium]